LPLPKLRTEFEWIEKDWLLSESSSLKADKTLLRFILFNLLFLLLELDIFLIKFEFTLDLRVDGLDVGDTF